MSAAAAIETPKGPLPTLVKLGFVVVVLAAWHIAASSGAVQRTLLPEPLAVLRALPGVPSSNVFLSDFAVTLYEMIAAFAIASVSALLVGYFIGRSRARTMEYEPLISALYAVPAILFYPIFILFFGSGPNSKIAIGAMIAFFPIVLSTIAGFGGVRPSHIAAARTMGASDMELLRHVMIPSALPVIATGLRMGLIVSLLAVLGTETLGSRGGLGYRLIAFSEMLEITRMYVYVIVIIATATAVSAIAAQIERVARRKSGMAA